MGGEGTEGGGGGFDCFFGGAEFYLDGAPAPVKKMDDCVAFEAVFITIIEKFTAERFGIYSQIAKGEGFENLAECSGVGKEIVFASIERSDGEGRVDEEAFFCGSDVGFTAEFRRPRLDVFEKIELFEDGDVVRNGDVGDFCAGVFYDVGDGRRDSDGGRGFSRKRPEEGFHATGTVVF